MIAKARGATREQPRGRTTSRRSRQQEPLDIRLSLAFRFGDKPDERVVMMDDRPVPLVGTVFQSRDRIFHAFSRLLLKAALRQPKVAAELVPVLPLLGRLRKKKP